MDLKGLTTSLPEYHRESVVVIEVFRRFINHADLSGKM
jgi:hypothetical protein